MLPNPDFSVSVYNISSSPGISTKMNKKKIVAKQKSPVLTIIFCLFFCILFLSPHDYSFDVSSIFAPSYFFIPLLASLILTWQLNYSLILLTVWQWGSQHSAWPSSAIVFSFSSVILKFCDSGHCVGVISAFLRQFPGSSWEHGEIAICLFKSEGDFLTCSDREIWVGVTHVTPWWEF